MSSPSLVIFSAGKPQKYISSIIVVLRFGLSFNYLSIYYLARNCDGILNRGNCKNCPMRKSRGLNRKEDPMKAVLPHQTHRNWKTNLFHFKNNSSSGWVIKYSNFLVTTGINCFTTSGQLFQIHWWKWLPEILADDPLPACKVCPGQHTWTQKSSNVIDSWRVWVMVSKALLRSSKLDWRFKEKKRYGNH